MARLRNAVNTQLMLVDVLRFPTRRGGAAIRHCGHECRFGSTGLPRVAARRELLVNMSENLLPHYLFFSL